MKKSENDDLLTKSFFFQNQIVRCFSYDYDRLVALCALCRTASVTMMKTLILKGILSGHYALLSSSDDRCPNKCSYEKEGSQFCFNVQEVEMNHLKFWVMIRVCRENTRCRSATVSPVARSAWRSSRSRCTASAGASASLWRFPATPSV